MNWIKPYLNFYTIVMHPAVESTIRNQFFVYEDLVGFLWYIGLSSDLFQVKNFVIYMYIYIHTYTFVWNWDHYQSWNIDLDGEQATVVSHDVRCYAKLSERKFGWMKPCLKIYIYIYTYNSNASCSGINHPDIEISHRSMITQPLNRVSETRVSCMKIFYRHLWTHYVVQQLNKYTLPWQKTCYTRKGLRV